MSIRRLRLFSSFPNWVCFLVSGLIFWTGGCQKAQEKPFLTVLPSSVNLQPGEAQDFIAVFADSGQPADAAWSVNGAVGGDATFGLIAANGSYTAPADFPDTVPETDRILISASAGGADEGHATVFLTTFGANQRITGYNPASFRADSRSGNQNNLAVSGNNVYIVWSDNRSGDSDIYLSRSTNGGVAFDLPIRVNSVTSGDQEHPALAVNPVNQAIYVVWEDASTIDRDISFAGSTNQGVSFSDRVVVNDNPGPSDPRDQILPTITVAPDETLYVAWEENENSNLTDSDIYVTASTDGGASFEDRLRVAGNVLPSELRSPALVVDSFGNTSLIWEDHTNFYATLQLSRISRDGNGDLQATDPVPFVPSQSLPSNTTQVHPSVAIDGNDRIYVVWENAVIRINPQDQKVTPTSYDIYLTTSSDGGVTFSEPVTVNQTEATGFFGGWAYPDVVADALGNIYIVWEDYRNGFLTPDIYFTKSSEGGNPDSYETARKVNDDTGLRHEKPSIGISDSGKALVAWTDFRNNASLSCNPCNNDIFFSREP